MSNYGPVSTLAYAAVVTWGFWSLFRLGELLNWDIGYTPLMMFALCALAARSFAASLHRRMT